jgi:hypothetical protein
VTWDTVTDSRQIADETFQKSDYTYAVLEEGSFAKPKWREEATTEDAKVRQDYMTLASHMLSKEDYAQLQEEGFQFEDLNQKEAVTILDQIKTVLLRSGKEIQGFTDQIDLETIQKAVGDEALGRSLVKNSVKADIPITQVNTQEILSAVDTALSLTTPTPEEYRYMVAGKMEPTIHQFTLAQNSGATQKAVAHSFDRNPRNAIDFYYKEDRGYLQKGGGTSSWEGMEAALQKTIESFGKKATPELIEDASFLVEHKIALTKDHLESYENLRSVTFPIPLEDAMRAACVAVGSGKSPLQGDLRQTETIYKQAALILDHYTSIDPQKEAHDLQGRLLSHRQLEEIRLSMTAQVNVRLIRSGFALETASIEETIEALKEAEQQVANIYFPDQDAVAAVEEYRQYRDVTHKFAMMPMLPSDIVVPYAQSHAKQTVGDFYETGLARQIQYEKAGLEYEKLMTQPTKEYGDSIQKAVQNAESLLLELGVEVTAVNQKTVRIMGYQQLPITPDHFQFVKDNLVQCERVIAQMTPAATLQMIRDGIHPLEQTMEQLDAYLSEQNQDFETVSQDYAQFLYGLEHHHQISAEERTAYIGVYRLLHQVQKNDSALIGRVLEAGQQVDFRNLLTAMRSHKNRIDVRVDDYFAGTQSPQETGSITEQIAQGYRRAYDEAALAQIREVAATPDEVFTLLSRANIPITSSYLFAAQELFKNSTKYAAQIDSIQDVSDEFPNMETQEDFETSYSESLEASLTRTRQRLVDPRDMRLQELQEMRLFYKQVQITKALMHAQEYYVPIELDAQNVLVRISLQPDTAQSGKVSVSMRMGEDEEDTVEAQITVQDGVINGYFAGKSDHMLTNLRAAADIFADNATPHWLIGSLYVLQGTGKMIPTIESRESSKDTKPSNQDLFRISKQIMKAMTSIINTHHITRRE